MKSLADFIPTGNVGDSSVAPIDRAGIDAMIERLSPEYGLDPQLVKAVVQHESNYNPKARPWDAKTKTYLSSAKGLMQLLDGTAKEVGVNNPYDPEQNLRGGMKYLSDQIASSDGDWQTGLRKYNQGPGGDLSKADLYVAAISKNYTGQNVQQIATQQDLGKVFDEVMASSRQQLPEKEGFSLFKNPIPGKQLATMAIEAGVETAKSLPQATVGKLPFGVENKGDKISQVLKDVMYGVPEAAGVLASGAAAFPLGQVAGIPEVAKSPNITQNLADAFHNAEKVNQVGMAQPQTATAQMLMKPIELGFGTLLGTVQKVVEYYNPTDTPEDLDKKVKAAQYVTNSLLVGAPLGIKALEGRAKVKGETAKLPETVEAAKEQVLSDPNIPSDTKVEVANLDVDMISNIAKQVKEARKAEKAAAKTTGEDVPLDTTNAQPKRWEPSPGDMEPLPGVADAFSGQPGTSYIATPGGPIYTDLGKVVDSPKVATPESIAQSVDLTLKYDGKMEGIPGVVDDLHNFTVTLKDGRQPSFSIAGEVTPEKIAEEVQKIRDKFSDNVDIDLMYSGINPKAMMAWDGVIEELRNTAKELKKKSKVAETKYGKVQEKGQQASEEVNNLYKRPIDTIHYSRSTFELGKIPEIALENDSVFGPGFYSMLPETEKYWQGMDRWKLGDFKNEVTVNPKNPLVITPETAPKILSELGISRKDLDIEGGQEKLGKYADVNGYDSLIIDGFNTPESIDFSKVVTQKEVKVLDNLADEFNIKFDIDTGKSSGDFVGWHAKAEKQLDDWALDTFGVDYKVARTMAELQDQIFVSHKHQNILEPKVIGRQLSDTYKVEVPSIIPEFDTIDLASGEGYTALTKKRYSTPEEASAKAYETEGAQVIKVGDKYRVAKYEDTKIPEYASEDALKADGWEALSEIPKRRVKYYEPQEGGGPVVKIGDKYYRTTKYEEMPDKIQVESYLDSISDKFEDDVSPEDWAALEEFKKAGTKYELDKVENVRAALEVKKVENTPQSNAALAQAFLEWRDSYVPKYDIGKSKDAKPVTKESLAGFDDTFKTFESEESAKQYLESVGKTGEVIRDPLTGKYSVLESDKFQMLDDLDMWDEGVEQYNTRDIYDDGEGPGPDFELSDTGTRDLFSIFNNERGSVDITPVYKAIDNIEKVVKAAKKSGQSIDEYLASIGADEIAINAFNAAMAQLPQLKQQVTEKDPVTSAIFKPEGKVVARYSKWKGQGDKRRVAAQSVPITEELANAVLSADRTKQWGTDIKFEDPISGKIQVHHSSNAFERFMEATETKINSFRSAGLSNIYSMWREAKRNAAIEKDTAREWIKGLKKEVGKDRLNDFAIAAYADMKSVKEAYATMGIKDIPQLTVREQQILESMLEYLRRHRDRANYVRVNTGQKPIPKLLDVNGKENYLPLLRDINVLRDLGISEGFTISDTGKLGELSKKFNGMFNPHSKKRNVSDIPIELDPFKAIERYLDYGIDELHISPVAALAKDLANVKLPRLDGKGKISLQSWNPQLATMLSKWSDHIVGKDPVATAMSNANPFFSRAANTLSKNLVIATIGGSLRTIFVQPTSYIIGIPTLLNGKSAVYGMYKLASRRPNPGLKELSVPVIREAEFAYKELTDYIQQGKMSGIKSFVAEKSLVPMKWMDSMMAEAAGNAALYYGEKYLKLKDKDLYRFADDVVERTQGMGLKGAVADVQSSAATKWLTLLQTFGIADFNLIARDVLGIKNPDVNRSQTILRVVKYTAATMLAGQLYKMMGLENVVPDPVGAYQEAKKEGRTNAGALLSAAGELLEKVPIIGGSAKYGSSLGGIAGEFGDIIPEAAQKFSELVDWNNLTSRQKRTNLRLVAKAIGYSMGIPFTNQIAKSINTAYKGGNPYEVIMGVYIEEQKKGLRPKINRPKMPRPGSQVN